MKTIPFVFAAVFAATASVWSQDAVSTGSSLVPEVSIPGEISDGKPSPPAPPPVLPDFKVKSTVAREMDVVEAPPMAGLPPVEGTITTTVHLVEDPRLPDPPPPLPPVAPDDPAVLTRLAEMAENYRQTQLVFVSATVYDHSRTHLRCYPSGAAKKEISAWSNLDFNHFGGFGTFEAKDADGTIRQYYLLMGIGNETIANAVERARILAEHGIDSQPPAIPELPDDKPAYVIEDTEPDPAAVQLIEDLHLLYRKEGTRMAAAYAARVEAEKQRREYLLANPPKPKDVTMHFWQREHPVGMSADTIKQGGGN